MVLRAHKPDGKGHAVGGRARTFVAEIAGMRESDETANSHAVPEPPCFQCSLPGRGARSGSRERSRTRLQLRRLEQWCPGAA